MIKLPLTAKSKVLPKASIVKSSKLTKQKKNDLKKLLGHFSAQAKLPKSITSLTDPACHDAVRQVQTKLIRQIQDALRSYDLQIRVPAIEQDLVVSPDDNYGHTPKHARYSGGVLCKTDDPEQAEAGIILGTEGLTDNQQEVNRVRATFHDFVDSDSDKRVRSFAQMVLRGI